MEGRKKRETNGWLDKERKTEKKGGRKERWKGEKEGREREGQRRTDRSKGGWKEGKGQGRRER